MTLLPVPSTLLALQRMDVSSPLHRPPALAFTTLSAFCLVTTFLVATTVFKNYISVFKSPIIFSSPILVLKHSILDRKPRLDFDFEWFDSISDLQNDSPMQFFHRFGNFWKQAIVHRTSKDIFRRRRHRWTTRTATD